MSVLAILGASGHGRVVADAALKSGHWQEIRFYDDAWPALKNNKHLAIYGDTEKLLGLTEKPDVIVAIGNNKIRAAKQQLLVTQGFNIATVVHPAATIDANAKIGPGSVVMANVVVNSYAQIGEGVILNTAAVIEHDCTIANWVHISPNVALAGEVVIGEYSWIGIGAIVRHQQRIAANVMVGAGAVVVKDITPGQTVVGNPARVLA